MITIQIPYKRWQYFGVLSTKTTGRDLEPKGNTIFRLMKFPQ